MSWITTFSEKAENILNTIDKNAANAFNKQSNSKSSSCIQDTSIYSNASSVMPDNAVSTCDLPTPILNIPTTYSNRIPTCTESAAKTYDNCEGYQSIRKELTDNFLSSEMLQNEIHSLNNEISLLLNRVKIEEQKSAELSTQLTINREKNSKLEEQLADLQSWRFSNNEIHDITWREKPFKTKIINENETFETNVHEHYDKQIEDLLQDKTILEETLRKKEDEIILLKSRLSQKTYCFSADELQSRLRALTITLVEKQSAMESLAQEKNNLLNKFNHLQKKYDEALDILHQSRINMNDTDDVKSQSPGYSSNNIFKRHLGNLYSAILHVSETNKFSSKRVSAWKLLLIVYIIFMHGVVFLLLYSNTPESTDIQINN